MKVYMTNLYEKISLHIKKDEKVNVIEISAADYINNVVSSVIEPVYSETVISVFIYLVRLYLSYQLGLNQSNIVVEDDDSTFRYISNTGIYLNIKILNDNLSEKYFITDERLFNFEKFTYDNLKEFKRFTIDSADQGIDAQTILCNYFSDIRQMRLYCRDIDNSGFPLMYGYNGDDVRYVRKYLNDISYVIPSVPRIQYSDDLYGVDTVTAVKCFQKSSDYDETGETSRILLERMRYLSVRITEFFEQMTLLRKISQNDFDDISDDEIRNAVISAASLNKEIDDGSGDIVQSFCSYYHIVRVDRYSIIQKLKKIWAIISETVPGYILFGYAQPFSGKQLLYGELSAEVTKFQSYIKNLSDYIPQIGTVHISGKYDDETLSAVKKYQKKYGITSDGRVGMFTWNGISDLYNYFVNTLAINDKKCYNNRDSYLQ